MAFNEFSSRLCFVWWNAIFKAIVLFCVRRHHDRKQKRAKRDREREKDSKKSN